MNSAFMFDPLKSGHLQVYSTSDRELPHDMPVSTLAKCLPAKALVLLCKIYVTRLHLSS
jgi:hypothetical protein